MSTVKAKIHFICGYLGVHMGGGGGSNSGPTHWDVPEEEMGESHINIAHKLQSTKKSIPL